MSPSEITRWATHQMPLRQRVFPNADGLTIEQMAHAIRSTGLEPYYIDTDNPDVAKAAIYAYLSGGIPALLIFALEGDHHGKRRRIGLHAATITGYSLPMTTTSPFGGALLKSGGIDKIYVHDDQVGPHARMEFLHKRASRWTLSTSWGTGGPVSNIEAIPQALLFPLYNKIRLSYKSPLTDVLRLDAILRTLSQATQALPSLAWDLRLTSLQTLRRDIVRWPFASHSEMQHTLSRSLPRFLWHATGWDTGRRLVEVVFDATDIDTGKYIRLIQIFDQKLEAALNSLAVQPSKAATELGRILGRVDSSGP